MISAATPLREQTHKLKRLKVTLEGLRKDYPDTERFRSDKIYLVYEKEIEYAPLEKRHFNLLLEIKDKTALFHKEYHYFKKSNREMAKYLDCSPSKIDQLFRELSRRDLTRNVLHFDNVRYRMLHPTLLYATWIAEWFCKGIYALETHQRTIKWIDDCYHVQQVIDPETGELMFERVCINIKGKVKYQNVPLDPDRVFDKYKIKLYGSESKFTHH